MFRPLNGCSRWVTQNSAKESRSSASERRSEPVNNNKKDQKSRQKLTCYADFGSMFVIYLNVICVDDYVCLASKSSAV